MLKYVLLILLFVININSTEELYVTKKTPIELIPIYNYDVIKFEGKYKIQKAFSPAFQEVIPKVIKDKGAKIYISIKNKHIPLEEDGRTIPKDLYWGFSEDEQTISYYNSIKIGKKSVGIKVVNGIKYGQKINCYFSMEFETEKGEYSQLTKLDKDLLFDYFKKQKMKLLIY